MNPPDIDSPLLFVIRSAGPLLVPLLALGWWLYSSQFRLLLEIENLRRRSPPARHHEQPLPYIQRRIRFHAVLVTTCPLLGLLGTVNGMLGTFDSLQTGGAGAGSILLASDGIARALVTTQIGLLLAIPGTLLLTATRSRRNRLESTLHATTRSA